MTPERWKQLDALCHEALELQGVARAAFLAKACGTDQQLREEAERLIAAYELGGNFIDSTIYAQTAGLMDDDRTESTVGHSIGPYQIISQLGRGGMGEVYLASDPRLERKLAIKVLPGAFTQNPDRVRRFEREAKAASATNHPNILTIYEIGQTEDLHFIATEFVEGVTLRELMDSSGMSFAETLEVAVQVASALAAAHEAGIVHRDLKPENVMMRPDGLVKVLDFGLAKLTERPAATPKVEGDSQTPRRARLSTEPGMVIGTINYMSPEQARGLKVDHRTDIFSLGVMLYEMVAGRRPFEGETVSDVLVAILRSEPMPVAYRCPEAPRELEHIINKALRKDREERYQVVKDLLLDLRSLKQGGDSGAAGSAVDRKIKRQSVLTSQRMLAITALITLLVMAAVYALLFRGAPTTAPTEIKSLAVLPLENLSRDPEQDYFADGMTEALITDLSKIGALRVISRTSVMRYRGIQRPLREIAGELKVDAVVEGSVLRVGERVRITAQLIEVASDRNLWAESYERELRDVLSLQSEVAQAVAREIKITLTPADRSRLERARPVNPEAHEAYLRGRFHWNKRTDEELKKSLEYFQRAIEIDPTYAAAYSGLADAYGILGANQFLPPHDSFPKTRAAALRALEIDDSLAEAHASLALSMLGYEWNWAGAEREFQQSFELNPSYAAAHQWYAFYLVGMGRYAEALAEIKIARQLDPFSPRINANVGDILYYVRDYDQAMVELRKALELDPIQARLALGRVFVQKRMYEEAITVSLELTQLLAGKGGSDLFLAYAYAAAGKQAEVRKTLEKIKKQSQQTYIPPFGMALVQVALGEKDQAFAWLEEAYARRSLPFYMMKADPRLDPLRSDPRFADLLRRMGLAP